MKDFKKVTRAEFDSQFADLEEYVRDLLWAIFNQPSQTSADIVDYSCECSMCGKPMPYRHCGMCTHCEMVWNS